MKKILVLAGVAALLAFSCAENGVREEAGTGNPDLVLTPPGGENAKIDAGLFQVLDLTYPGLEQVRSYYEAGDLYRAASALLSYYRTRTSVFHPHVRLLNPVVSENARNIADQALQYRFYVRNFKEKVEGGREIYYDFKAPKGDSILWNILPVKAQEFVYQKHRHQWMRPQAEAYRATGNEEYVKSWIKVYGSWLEAYPVPEGRVRLDTSLPLEAQDAPSAWYGLQPAERLLDQLDYLWYFLPSANFTPEWLSRFLTVMARTAEVVRNNPVAHEDSNIRLAQDQAVVSAAMLMPEFKQAGEWLRHGSAEIARHLEHQFNADGVQNELDPSYHMGVIGDFIRVHEIAQANHHLDRFPSDYVEHLRKACGFLADIVWPDCSIDNFNDTRSGRMSRRVILRNLRTYAALFPDDGELAYMASEGRTEEPAALVKTYPVSGWYMMKSGWKPSSLMLIHKNNDNTGRKWHCQNDNGTVSVYRKGRCFTPDAGVYTYDTGPLRNAFAAADNHNTLTKEGGGTIDYAHSRGRLLTQATLPDAELLVTENRHYDDLTHRRAIFMVEKSFFVLVDEAYGTLADRPVILNFGLCRDCARTGNAEAEGVVVFDEDAAHFTNGAHTEFEDGNNMLFRTFTDTRDGYRAENGKVGYYSDNIGEKLRRRRYQVIVEKKAGSAVRFITVIVPVGGAAAAAGMRISAEFTDNPEGRHGVFHPEGAAVRVCLNGRTYDLAYRL